MHVKYFVLTAAVAIAACAPTSQGSDPAPFNLAGSEWAPQEGVEAQFIQFKADGNVNGNGGCNRFGGPYSQDENQLSIGPLISTRMACLDLDKETGFFEALDKTRSFKGDHLKLVLMDDSGEALLKLDRRDWD